MKYKCDCGYEFEYQESDIKSHFLMCGDSTKIEDVEKLMDGKKADMVFTDPPYKMKTEYFGYKGDLQYGNLKANKPPLYSEWLVNCEVISKADFGIFVFEQWYNLPELWEELEKFYKVKNLLLWYVPDRFCHANRMFLNRYDIILYATKGKYTFHNTMVNRFDTIISHKKETLESTGSEIKMGSKPVKVLTELMSVTSNNDDLIVDIFGGKGTTLIACEQIKRICYMMEIYPSYCDVIRKRYANFIGKGEEWQKITPKI